MNSSTILPCTAVLEMTYLCNHKCRFCSCPWYADMIPVREEMGMDEWKDLIAEFADAGVEHFTFTGGEALLKEGLLDLIDFAVKAKARTVTTENGALVEIRKNATANLLSNGRLVNDDVLRFCAERGILLSISLPGLRTFAENTDSDTSPAHILGLFARAKELGCETAAGIAVTKLNLPELYETIAAAIIAGADSVLLNRFLPGGRGLRHPELVLSAEEIVQMADVADEVLRKSGRTGHLGTEMPDCMIDRAKYKHLKVTTGCSAARQFFTVGPGGMIRTCNHSPVELLYWRDYRRLPEIEGWMSYIRGDYLPGECAKCGRKGVCMGGCRAAAQVTVGDPRSLDPIFARHACPGWFNEQKDTQE